MSLLPRPRAAYYAWASLRLTVCVYSACRPTVGHDKQRSGGFKSARGDPDSFDLHSAKITMSASSCCRLDSCVLRLKSPLTGGVSRRQGIKYWILQIAALSDQKILILTLKFN